MMTSQDIQLGPSNRSNATSKLNNRSLWQYIRSVYFIGL